MPWIRTIDVTAVDPLVARCIVWTLRACARRDRGLPVAERRLSRAGLQLWRQFAGRLHEGDLVSLLVENNAALSPLALRPLGALLDAELGRSLLREALEAEPSLLNATSASFLESAAVAFGRPELSAGRRAAFEAIRAQDQRILELPSTAGRVTAMVAPAGAPLDTYVGYVVAEEDDRFLIGLVMLEFERTGMPTMIDTADLQRGHVIGAGSFSRAATLGGEQAIIDLFPEGLVQRVVAL